MGSICKDAGKDKAEVIQMDQIQATPSSTRTIIQVKQPKPKIPFFMLIISAIQIALFYSFDMTDLLLVFGYDPYRRYEIWRYFTPMFVHAFSLHLWSNVIGQLILGVWLEVTHHWKRIAIIYLASVLGGSLFLSVLNIHYGGGASGAVYGLLFAHLSTIILNWNEMNRKCCRLFWLLLFIGSDVGSNMYSELTKQATTSSIKVSHAGHLGGALTGFLVSFIVLKNFKKRPWEKTMQKICTWILFGIFIVILLVNISFPSLYPNSEFNFEYRETLLENDLKVLNQTYSEE